jgi:aromatic-L-amino-acid decarboxylase
MDWNEFARWGGKIAEWGADYHRTLRKRPVRANTAPGAIAGALPATPPETGEAMEAIFSDFENVVMPGMTHWQHPRFFAYFPANAAPPSMLAEFLATTVAAQCMLWQTSPAATEVETVMLSWLRQAIGLPDTFQGVIQDSASSASAASRAFASTARMRSTRRSTARSGSPESGPRIWCAFPRGDRSGRWMRKLWQPQSMRILPPGISQPG